MSETSWEKEEKEKYEQELDDKAFKTLRDEIAIQAMNGILASGKYDFNCFKFNSMQVDAIAQASFDIAKEMVNRLKNDNFGL